jgi:hypothetical protein
MQLAQGDFWINPTGVIRNRNPAPLWFTRQSNPSLRQSPPFSQSLKERFFFFAANLLDISLINKLFPFASLAE